MTARTAQELLAAVGGDVKDRFVRNRTILSFAEYLELFLREPRAQARSAAQYLRDAMDFYGTDELETPVGPMRRFRLFDLPFEKLTPDAPAPEARVAGHEQVQNALYRQISNFVRAGRVNRLLLLHGPNGSAKTSLINALGLALEDYSQKDQGARYRFNWVFPSEKLGKGRLGFGAKREEGETHAEESFAHLEGDVVEARIVDELKDPPIFLLPGLERRRLLVDSVKPDDDFVLSDYMLDGELNQKNRAIFNALLTHYQGDFLKVMRHVQVERFFVSRRYQIAAATVEPQLSVDAELRQITADRSHGALPQALANVALFEPSGPLVSANRGLMEYSDLLKRPLEAYKYLLGTVETGSVALGPFSAQLDCVLIASSNEKHLAAFKEIPDFPSFKARIELVRVPYLRRFGQEREIYDQQLGRAGVGKHLAPHATRVAAKWAVLTRLKKPMVDRYKGGVRALLDDLSPHDKLVLYDEGRAPDRLSLAQANELRGQLPNLWKESDSYPNYEGRSGASAREMKNVIFNSAQNPQYQCLTPFAVLEELGELVKDKSVYEFLQQERVDGYHAHEDYVRVVESDLLDVVDEEVRDSMGLVSEAQYRDLFERYVQHVSAWLKGEKLLNRMTGDFDKSDEELMAHTEGIVMPRGQDRKEFRRGLITSVGAFRLDHPDGEIDYSAIFPDLFRRLRDHYFEERKKTLRRNGENVLKYLSDDRAMLVEKERTQVEEMLATMKGRYHWCEHCAQDAILFLMRKRYSG